MIIYTIFVFSMIVAGEATVMYTFYPPMQASPWFYIGLVFIVLGIWAAAAGVFITVAHWRKQNRGKHIPLLSYFAVGVFVILFFGSFVLTFELLSFILCDFVWIDTITFLVRRILCYIFV